MKLKRNPYSNRSMEAMDRAFHRVAGKRYPISGRSARRLAKMYKGMYYEDLSDVCPN